MSETEQQEEEDGFGLDKEARLRVERESEEKLPEPLNPPFPFMVVAVDPLIVPRNED
jgi:hypothetical protein